MQPQDYKYWAFISYSHQDRAWGNWLHRSLETYRLPRRLVGREHWSGPLPRRLAPVFRDRDELPSSADLSGVINQALRDSRYLIVICSPQSASSRWVNEEIKHFKALGRADRVLPLIIGGEPNASDRPESGLAECLPPAVRFEVSPEGELTDRRTEPIAADARGGKDGRADALLKLIAGMIGVGFDELKQRERRRLLWKRALGTAAIVMLTIAAAGFWHWQKIEKQAALEAQALKNRIATLYDNGRKELLAHNEARAAVYLGEVLKLGVDTPALRFMLGRALLSVGAQSLRVQTGTPVLLTELSSDGARLLTVGQDHILQLWDARSGKQEHEIPLGDTREFFAAFSPKGSFVWSDTNAGSHRVMRIYSAASGQLLKELPRDSTYTDALLNPIDASDRWSVNIPPDGSLEIVDLGTSASVKIAGAYSTAAFCNDDRTLVAGTQNGDVIQLNRADGRTLRSLAGLRGPAVALTASPECAIIAAGSATGAIRIWDGKSGRLIMTGGHTRSISQLQLSSDGSRLMSLSSNSVTVWDVYTGTLLYAARFPNPLGLMAVMNPDGRTLALATNSVLAIIDVINGSIEYTLDGHQGNATTFNFSADGRQLVSGGPDGSAVVWNPPKFGTIQVSTGSASENAFPEDPETQVGFSGRGESFYAAGANGRTYRWTIAGPDVAFQAPLHVGPVSAISVSPSGNMIATGGWDGKILFAVTGADRIGPGPIDAGGKVWSLAFDATGGRLLAAIEGGKTGVWSTGTGERLLLGDRDNLMSQAFTIDGSALIVGRHGSVDSVDLVTKKLLWSTQLPVGPAPQVGAVAVTRDGRFVLATAERSGVFLLNAKSGEILRQASAPSAAGMFVADVAANGDQAIVGDAGKSVFLWRPFDGRILRLDGHTAQVTMAAFNPAATMAISGASDGAVKIWDPERGELLDSFFAHDGSIGWGSGRFSGDGKTLLTGGTDHFARLWDVPRYDADSKALQARIGCMVPWTLDGEVLISSSPSRGRC